MLNVYFAEALGSFVFFSIVLSKPDAVMIAVALLVGILISSIASQSHLNPAVTAMCLMEGKVSGAEATGYVVSQLIGAVVAVQWFRMYKNETKPKSESIF
jgi:glycerol uptake facilitator-like aquaporin